MTSVNRLAGLMRRLKIDRRLPPVVTAMATQMIVARVTRRYRRLRANLLPPVGGRGKEARIDYWLGRRVATTAVSPDRRPSPSSFAEQVQRICAAEGINSVAVDSTPTQVRLAVALEDRPVLWRALRGEAGTEFIIASWRGGRPSVVSRRRRRRPRPLAAPVWLLLRAAQRGTEVNTEWCRVEVTFWQLGASGQREMVGVRHNERFDEGTNVAAESVEDASLTVFEGRSMARRIDRIHEPIDVVFTWVDGDDPVWRHRMLAARGADTSADEQNVAVGSDSAVEWERYETNDELRYGLRSIADFAPWVRHVWLVTDGQRPAWLIDHPRVSVVDHRSIFPDGVLPVFNSHAIEAVLHRIPGLAERFLYFNDDFFLGRPLAPTDFFASDQIARVFPADAPVRTAEDEATAAVDTAALRGNEVLAHKFGRVARFKLLHTPQPLFRSILEDIERSIPELHAQTVASRFRSSSDLSIPSFLAPYWSVETGKGVISSLDNRYVSTDSPRLAWILDSVLQFGCDTLCLNQTEPSASIKHGHERLTGFLAEMFPVPGPWEAPEM